MRLLCLSCGVRSKPPARGKAGGKIDAVADHESQVRGQQDLVLGEFVSEKNPIQSHAQKAR